jgi:hypothetical protein
LEIAPRLCGDCSDYHITKVANRLAGATSWSDRTRPYLIESLRPLLAALLESAGAPVDIVIAGAANTAVFATCAHTAATLGGDMLARTRFTVLDLCDTPLTLCRDFAGRFDLKISTRAVDFVKTADVFPADLILLHSILNFIPFDAHLGFLDKLGDWLKPRGRILCWNTVVPANDRADDQIRRREQGALTQAVLSARLMASGTTGERIASSVNGWSEPQRPDGWPFSSGTAVRDLFLAAGLQVHSFGTEVNEWTRADGSVYRKPRVVIVAGRDNPPA